MKRSTAIVAAVTILVALVVAGSGALVQREAARSEAAGGDQWEYLVVAGGNVNLRPTDSGTLRKQPEGAFSREAFPVEQNLDKLGSKGWELVAVSGATADPTYYFKRRR